MNQELTKTNIQKPRNVSSSILLGTILLVITSALYVWAGNAGDFHGNLLASGAAANKAMSIRVWTEMGNWKILSAVGIAIGVGVIAAGVASTCAPSGQPQKTHEQ